MPSRLLPVVLSLLLVGAANAQPDTAPLAFEVASVKQRILPPGSFMRRPHSPGPISCSEPIATVLFDCGISGTRFSDSPSSLLDLIIDAFKVRSNEVIGLPDWGDSGHDIYDVNARVAGTQTPTLDQVRQMLQTLLADRFQLRVHRETRVLPVYDLVVSKKPKLIKSAKPCGVEVTVSPSDDDVVPLPLQWKMIPALLSVADRPVIDKTGYEAEARYCVPGQNALFYYLGPTLHPEGKMKPPEEIANTVNDMEGVWGLKMVPQKGPMTVLVIDHVERPSPDN